MDLTQETEEVVEALTQDLLRQEKLTKEIIPRPPFSEEAPMEVRLQRLDQSFNPVTMSALRKIYGRKALVQELLSGGLLVSYLQRKLSDGTQSLDAIGAEGPETTVGPAGRNGRTDASAGG